MMVLSSILPLTAIAGDDWGNFGRYEKDNAALKESGNRPKAVFMGNSITEGWVRTHPDFFTTHNFVGRGISGQTSYQMLLRFRDDVLDLGPEVAVINAGTNDIAENNHVYNEDRTFGNIVSMAEMARSAGITPVLTSVLPAGSFPWRKEIKDAPAKVTSLNGRIREYASANGLPYIDYYSLMVGNGGAMNSGYSGDGIHPNPKGYEVMEAAALDCPALWESPIVISLRDKNAPSENGLTLADERVEAPWWIFSVAHPELYVYPAPRPNGKAMIMCPGGSYAGVAIEKEGKAIARRLNKDGITVAVLKYRMPNGHSEVPAKDVAAAMEVMRMNASKWGVNPEMIGVGGASAGGHLASTVATHFGKADRPAFQVLLYPVISMKDELTHRDSRNNLLGSDQSPKRIELYSNELQVTVDTPPAFIVLSADDDGVKPENSLLYYDALKKNGVPASLHVYPTGKHGWGYGAGFDYNEEWISNLAAWINNL